MGPFFPYVTIIIIFIQEQFVVHVNNEKINKYMYINTDKNNNNIIHTNTRHPKYP